MIYRCDHRHKPAQVDDTPRRKEREKSSERLGDPTLNHRARAVQTSEDAPARLPRSEIGEESSPVTPEKSRRARRDALHTRAYNIRRKGKRRRNEPHGFNHANVARDARPRGARISPRNISNYSTLN